MTDFLSPLPTSGTFGETPWVTIVGHLARKRFTGRIDVEAHGTHLAIRFHHGFPAAVLSGDDAVPHDKLLDQLVELVKLPDETTWSFHEGDDSLVGKLAGMRTVPVEPLALVLRAIAIAPPRARVQADKTLAAVGKRPLDVKPLPPISVPRALERLTKRLAGGARTVEGLLSASSPEEREKDELYVYALLVAGTLTLASAPTIAKKAPAIAPKAPPAPKLAVKPEAAPAPVIEEKVEPAPTAEEEEAAPVSMPSIPVIRATPSEMPDEILISVTIPPPAVLPAEPALKVDDEGYDARWHADTAAKQYTSGALDACQASLAKALALEPDYPDACALSTWLEVLPAKNPTDDDLAVAVARLGEILKESPRCERAYFYRGVLWKRLGKNLKAAADLDMALEINPNATDVTTELRLLRKPEDPMAKSQKAPATSFEKPKSTVPVDRVAQRRRRMTILGVVTVLLGLVSVYLWLPKPPPADAPTFDWVPK